MVKKRDIYKDLKTKYSTKEILGKHVSRAQNWEEGGKGLPGLYEEPTGERREDGGSELGAQALGTKQKGTSTAHCISLIAPSSRVHLAAGSTTLS